MKTGESEKFDSQMTAEGFYNCWLNQVRKGFGYMRAYENAEIIHVKEYGKERYSDYKSFARSRPDK